MKRFSKIFLPAMLVIGLIGFFSISSAQNRQEYSMNKALCAHYIKIAREQVENDNLPLAKVYAQKAIQANPWDKAAWANYDDIAQRLADNGELKDFDTFIEESEEANQPSASDGANKFEGC